MSTSSYSAFLARKSRAVQPIGHEVDDGAVHPMLHPWQVEIVQWAVRTGRAAIWADTGLGKALDSETLVVTPNGMVPIRDLRPGDFVTGANGAPTRVMGVYPQGTRPGHRVTFSDDSSVVCDDEHLWTVRTRRMKWQQRPWQTLTLREIQERGIGTGTGSDARRDRWFIPMAQPAEFTEPDLPLHPYLLGCLIGDGYIKTTTPKISTADVDMVEHLREVAPLGITIEKTKYSKYDYALTRDEHHQARDGAHRRNPITEALDELGLQGHDAESKFVPDLYKFAATDTRLLVLQGLMDTDGYVGTSHGVSTLEFCTVSRRLADDFVFLVQSLGGKGRIRTKKTAGRMAYRVTPALPEDVAPFLLKRKADMFQKRTKYMPARSIRSIEPVDHRDMTCIKVAAEDGLFVVEGFIVTHNTVMQLEWGRLSGDTVLIVAPLAVCQQTVREAAKLGVDAHYVRSGDQITGPGVWVTNYEMIDRFDPVQLDAVVLDEASILKNSDGKTRALLIRHFAPVPRRLACTATPAPNDPEELTNQAEWLGVTTRTSMLSAYFVHDTDGWRLKGHARRPMFRWMASWAVALRRPSDLGYPDEEYELPPLTIHSQLVDVDVVPDDQLFATDLGGVGGRAAVRRQTLDARCQRAAELVAADADEPWLIWCGLNDEADLLTQLIPDAVNVHGGMSPEEKADALLGFADGTVKHLISKPRIASFGMNWQHCARMAFVGLSDSWEAYYQGIRRCWRYGQHRPVHVHLVLSELESQIATNVKRKEREAFAITSDLVSEMARARTHREAS